MLLRLLSAGETAKLAPCLAELAAYHNDVSINFKGCYPGKPFAETLAAFAQSLAAGTSQIAVLETGEEIAGFCKIDFEGSMGKLTHLVVLPKYRGCGCGKQLMDWAMAEFKQRSLKYIEVKVVDGNDAIHLYEKYGFKMNAHILRRALNDNY